MDLRRFLQFCEKAGIEYPDQVTFREAEMCLAWIQHQCVKATTANRHRFALWRFCQWARREGLIAANPIWDVEALKTPHRLPEYLRIPEQERVLEVLSRDDSL